MDDVTSGLGDAKDQDRIYHKAQIQIDKILDPDTQMPSIFMQSKKRLELIFFGSWYLFGQVDLCIWVCRADYIFLAWLKVNKKNLINRLINISPFFS